MPQLSRERIEAELAGLPGWSFDGGALVRTFRFAGFVEAVAFVSRLVPGAEAADHHPDLSISYRTVIVSWTTHSEGGVTDQDLAGVRMTEACHDSRI